MQEYQLVDSQDTVYRDGTIKLHTQEGFEGMRRVGQLSARILDEVADWVKPGVTTESIDTKVREMMMDAGAVPATLGYRGYAHSSCISINHVICHGIPSDKVLKEGDILNVDVTSLLDGWHGDTSRMYFVGEPSIKAKRLVDVTYECMMLGIEAAKPGARLGDIGAAIENVVPRAHGSQARSIGSPAVKLDVGTRASSPKEQSEKSPWVFRAGMLVLLGVLLIGLFAYRSRPQLYNNTTLRPALETACKIMRCTLPARVDVASLKMVKRNVYSHPSTPNALVINVSFRNEAEFAQQLPVLQMVLSNRVGRVVAKQDFIPNHYMPNWQDGAVIEANQQLDVKLEVTDPGQDAQNFEFHFLEFKS